MRVIHVVPTISNEASGPSYSVPRLCEALIAEGADVQLAALAQPCTRIELPFVKTFPLGLGPARLGASPKLRRWLDDEAASGRVQIVHNHSLWMMPNVYPGRACRERRCRLVISPRGTLSTWALRRSAVRKKIFWRWMQEPVLRSAACFHATAESEYEDVRRLGFTQPLCVLPNGIDVPPLEKSSAQDGRRQLLYLGRIHPIKGLEVLLRAWQAVASRFPEWELRVVGPEEGGYRARMQGLAAELRLQRIEFPGPLYGEDKLHAYRQASVFVLPTYSENFGMSVAEALAAGIPAIVTRGAPWSGLVENDAGWWIETGLDSLVACLEQTLANSPQRLDDMGRAGHAWMQRDFCWQRIGRQFMATYQWLLDGGVPPVWVRLD